MIEQKSHRLIFFISSMSSGGAERVTANLANHWVANGWEISIVSLSDTTDDFYFLNQSIQRIGLGLLQKSPNPIAGFWNNLRRVFVLRRILRQSRPDVALAIMDKSSALLAIAAVGMPHTITIGSIHCHPPKIPLSRLWQSITHRWYSSLDAITTLTSESQAWVIRNTNAKKVVVIPNAIPWPLPVHPPVLLPENILPSEKKCLLTVGRLCWQKGFDLLIDSFRSLASKHQDWDLMIVGEGPLKKSLAAKINQEGLQSRVMLVGSVGNIADWYRAADLYVMSSRSEGFGNSLAEALAHGVPSVSFDCETGPRDILRHGVDGLLVADGNKQALTRALDRLMGDAALRRNFSVNAIETRERFSITKVAGMWEQLFEHFSKENTAS